MKKLLLLASIMLPLSLFALIGTEEVKVETLYDVYRANYLEPLSSDELRVQKLSQTQTLLDQYANRPSVSLKLKEQINYLSHLFCHTRSLFAQELCIDNYRPESVLTRSKDNLTIDQIRALLGYEHSRRRVERNLSKLTLSSGLNTIAQNYAEKLCAAGEITHTLDGSTLSQRYQDGNYDYVWGGENLGQGQQSIMELLDQLTTSIHHRENMYKPEFREVGIGQCDTIWVINYGSRQR